MAEHDFPGPVAEDFNVAIAQGETNAQIWVVPHNRTEPVLQQVEVVGLPLVEATQAYVINEAVTRRPLSHGDLQWGHVYRGFSLPRRHEDLVFQEPTDHNRPIPPGRPVVPLNEVIIKRLYRDVVAYELRRGSAENPMMEIFRMQEIGDDLHVLGLIEALQNQQYIYIISRFCEAGSLADHTPLYLETNLHAEGEARYIFRQMLEAANYVHNIHGICHRDIDPGNFLVTGQGRVLLNDMAMSFKIPPGGIVRPIGQCGKRPYHPPEIFLNQAFDARQSDLWACVVSLFNLLTGQRPYLQACPSDIGFRYCILAGAFAENIANERVMDLLQDMDYTADTYYPEDIPDRARVQISFRDTMVLATLVPRVMALSPPALELFHNCLRANPQDRWTMEEMLTCEWMTMDLPDPE
jgi:serine/threonine protein kinase